MPAWLTLAGTLATTEGSDPRLITGIILDNTADYSVEADQIPSGAIARITAIGRLLMERMQDEANAADYLGETSNTVAVVEDWVQVAANAFNHELAWEEAVIDVMVTEASAMMAGMEELAYFLLQVGNDLSEDLASIAEDSNQEVFKLKIFG